MFRHAGNDYDGKNLLTTSNLDWCQHDILALYHAVDFLEL